MVEQKPRKQTSHGLSDQAKATTMSICLISFTKIILFIGLDTGALVHRNNCLERAKDIIQQHPYYWNNQWHTVQYSRNAACIWCYCFRSWLVDTTIALCILCIRCNCFKKFEFCNIKDFHNYYFALTVIPLIVSSHNHAPYVFMAYVSDANYAGRKLIGPNIHAPIIVAGLLWHHDCYAQLCHHFSISPGGEELTGIKQRMLWCNDSNRQQKFSL